METSHPDNQPNNLPDENVVVIAEKQNPISGRVSRLIKVDGKLMCECPYLCGATSEKCDFDAEFNWNNEKLFQKNSGNGSGYGF